MARLSWLHYLTSTRLRIFRAWKAQLQTVRATRKSELISNRHYALALYRRVFVAWLAEGSASRERLMAAEQISVGLQQKSSKELDSS
ncbi:unnamed protein product [Protopolystoma xenopodis]|uniref:Uncharacterized protein n=1 Tax=Protopolystoma xenopodis TaxID=117903 RepID=A0A448X4S8_9PLAT|nr:unnamed protein product [Protopolystoma xenopodis]